jgi:uncharacterized membrane protein YkvA (DUF1232 family)
MQSWALLLVLLGVTLLVYATLVCWLVALGRRDDARALATFIPDCIVLVSRPAREPRVPRRRKLLLLALVGYLGLPFDLVPDFIPVAGQLDDAIIVALALGHFIRVGGEPLIRELWPGPERSLALILKEGASVGRVSRLLGHASPAITLQTYAHAFATAEHYAATRKRMEPAFGDVLAGAALKSWAFPGRRITRRAERSLEE